MDLIMLKKVVNKTNEIQFLLLQYISDSYNFPCSGGHILPNLHGYNAGEDFQHLVEEIHELCDHALGPSLEERYCLLQDQGAVLWKGDLHAL